MGYKVCIIGSGINGLACALNLGQQFCDCHLTILAAEFPPNTTRYGKFYNQSSQSLPVVPNSLSNIGHDRSEIKNYLQKLH